MHWKHSDFQLCYQLIGDCHTIDEAIRIAYMLREERNHAISLVGAESDRAKAKIVFSENTILSHDDTIIDKLNAQANLAEQLTRNKLTFDTMPSAEHETDTLTRLIHFLEPKSKLFVDSGTDSFQLIQNEENFYHCYWTAYVNMLSSGYLTSELVQLVKLHPMSKTLDLLISNLKHSFDTSYIKTSLMSKFDVLSGIDYALTSTNNSRFLVSSITEDLSNIIGLDYARAKFNTLPSNIRRITEDGQ